MEHYVSKSCLDGEWRLYIAENKNCKDFADEISTEKELKKKGLKSIAGTVPGNFELDMQRAGQLPENLYYDTNVLDLQKLENRHIWYVCEFDFRGDTEGQLLRFDGIDTIADIYLNGEYVYSADNMFLTHEISVEDELKQGKNELVVHIEPPVISERDNAKMGAGITASQPYNFGSLRVRKAAHMYGWDIMPRVVSGGIWKSVYLCKEKKERINATYMYTKNHDRLDLITMYYDIDIVEDDSKEYTISVEGVCGDSTFTLTDRVWHTEGRIEGTIENPKLWWPRNMGEQNLYDVTVKLIKGNKVLDTKTFRHGIRYVKLIKSDYIDENGNGDFKFTVNGKPFFAFGTNWVPLDPLHSRDKERLPKALELLLESGSNIVRCWGGNVYESEDFYNFCDEHGIAIWQDFAMGCATYPQDECFQDLLKDEALQIIKRYRQHPALFLWAGDNEVDVLMAGHRDPNKNILTRKVLPEALEQEDPFRPYLPSSPYVSQKAYDDGMIDNTPEQHLWGPRRYYKEEYYRDAVCRFVSETGYHGCNSPTSVKKFIAPENLWPWKDNKAWLAHAACMEVDKDNWYTYRIALMASHLNILFGDTVPDGLEDFSKASQISQAEAFKYFIERFRTGKINWERTGVIWWNLLDGWPQFSDAVVDYYYCRKLAYFTIRRIQEPVCVMFRDPTKVEGKLELIGVNEFPEDKDVSYKVTNLETDETLLEGSGTVGENGAIVLGAIDTISEQTCLLITYMVDGKEYKNHYLTGEPTYDYKKVCEWLDKAGLLNFEGF